MFHATTCFWVFRLEQQQQQKQNEQWYRLKEPAFFTSAVFSGGIYINRRLPSIKPHIDVRVSEVKTNAVLMQ